MSEDLQSLVRKRSSIKAKLTTFEKYIQSKEDLIKSSFESDPLSKVDRASIIELQERILKIEATFQKFDEIQDKIECEADNIDEQFKEREQFECKYYSLFSNAKLLLEMAESPSEDEAVSMRSSQATFSEGVRLPEIKLSKFDGSYETWMEFRDIFESLIHNNPQINAIQKYHYLRASLTGAAQQVIQSLEFSAQNYSIAWDTLCERFNNKRLLIQNHIKAIFNAKNISNNSATEIRNLCDNVSKNLKILSQLGEPTEYWDTLIIFITSNKLDISTAREWENRRSKLDTISLDNFKDFLYKRADLLETINSNLNFSNESKKPNEFNKKPYSQRYQTRGLLSNAENQNNSKSKYTCILCKREHSLFYCPDFLSLSVSDKKAKVRQLELCNNCLRRNHTAKDCTWSGCKICNAKHNTVLHDSRSEQTETRRSLTVTKDETQHHHSDNTNTETTNCYFSASQSTILSTAQVNVDKGNGKTLKARALLDCGSQSSFVTTEFCEKLNLPLTKIKLAISGINEKLSYANNKCELTIHSKNNDYSFKISCFVIDTITSALPDTFITRTCFDIPVNITLADPDFHIPKQIDILIGADAFWPLLDVGQYELGSPHPILQNTHLGWVVAGPLGMPRNTSVCHFKRTNIDLQQLLTKFWEIEEVSPSTPPRSVEEILCEKHYLENTKIGPDGRYVVSLPFKNSSDKLGNSRELAIKRFSNLEKRLNSNETLRELYIKFLDEYEQLGHMIEITDKNDKPEYYMPHHGVLRESSSTTKLRVVFNASSPTSTGISLNDLQMVGPTIQQDILSILLRFRLHPIAISSDIRMMYRQILINPEHRNLQKIVWRSSPDEPIKTYRLNTVTYGTTAASFLAIRCLHEVANECENDYPKIAKIIREDMYVDDLLTSVDTESEAKYVCNTIYEILLRHGFDLRKWKSNNVSILQNLNTENAENSIDFSGDKENCTKTLGLSWMCNPDLLIFKIPESRNEKITKRVVLSRIATIFDPLGLISPCIIIAKTLLQKLWAEKITWDDPLPSNISNTWLEFSEELSLLNALAVERNVTCNEPTAVYLHGFADASEKSYGACVYVVSKNKQNKCKSNLLCAKSKVAPLKTLTMPRLELCAALLLSQLLSKILKTIDIKIDAVFCWSDSSIVLCWLRTPPNVLKPFVDNRVAEVQRLTKDFSWKHVTSKDNPADVVSRGLSPKQLQDCYIWWHGPHWLLLESSFWPNSNISINDLPERRKTVLLTSSPIPTFDFERFSDLLKLKRAVAFAFRFISNLKLPKINRPATIHLTLNEINNAFERILKIAQQESFPQEYNILLANKNLPSNSTILSLHPFMDNQKLMRVGGRLSNSDLPYSKKHPILLSDKHHLTRLLFEYEHKKLLHAGPQLLLSHIRESFWPISGRKLSKKTFRNCVRCARYNNNTVQPLMGDLPASRIQPSLPFSTVGIDYAGPFNMRDRRGRGSKSIKCWIALFVCFSTRAIHLELVLSLSSEDFIQAFHRFISRRGKPSYVYSDNGTNFVKANKDMQQMAKFLEDNSLEIEASAANLGIKWSFIPINSPHFGGIWESGIKSVKLHLKRALGNHSIFFNDFQTLLIRIEAVLNSRPLTPLTCHPEDLTALTPAHFLIGRQLLTIPTPSVSHVPENRLSQFKKLHSLYEHFWRRWSQEYLSELQRRVRWKVNSETLKIDQLVLVKDNNLPPMKWRLGRIVDLVPGRDGVHRVAAVRTSDGVISRAVVRLCPLPVES